MRTVLIGRRSSAEPASAWRALVDLRWMDPGVAGGIENMSRSFLAHLARRPHAEEQQFTVLAPAAIRYELAVPKASHIRILTVDGPLTYARRAAASMRSQYWRTPALELRRRIAEVRAKVGLSMSGYIHPDLASMPSVLVMPDLQHEYLPDLFTTEALEERRRIYTTSAHQAHHLCAMSDFTRRTVIERLGVPAERISTVHLAADPMFFPEHVNAADCARTLQRYGLTAGTYLLFPANTWRHKNHACAVEALRILRERDRLDPILVLAGAPKEAHRALCEQVHAAGLSRQVRVLGYCHPTRLPALYRGAAALVFPSLFEGFGLPLVEAMWSDCPVVCSDVTSLPEIAGDAALLVDPRSPEQLAEGIARVLTDADTRETLITRGRKRATQFSWSRFTEGLLCALERVAPPASPSARGRARSAAPLAEPRGSRLSRRQRAARHVREIRSRPLGSHAIASTLGHAAAATCLSPRVVLYLGLCAALRVVSLRRLRKRESHRVLSAESEAHRHRLEPWSDGWAGPRLRVERRSALPARALCIVGRSALWPFTLTVRVDERIVARLCSLHARQFSARIPLPRTLQAGVHVIEIDASRWIVPDRHQKNADRRPLSWRMFEIELERASCSES